jgi:hypothetical protein
MFLDSCESMERLLVLLSLQCDFPITVIFSQYDGCFEMV